MKQMTVSLDFVYPEVLWGKKHQRFKGSSSAGDLMCVDEGKGIQSHFIQVFVSSLLHMKLPVIEVFIYYCKNINAESGYNFATAMHRKYVCV